MGTRVSGRTIERQDQAGFSLIELMVATLVSTLVVGGVMLMLNAIQDVHRDTQEMIDAQQSARISMEQIQRDLQLAGVGLVWLVPPLPLIVPQADGGLQLRHNQSGVTASLSADMANQTDAFTVDDVTGFAVGQTIGIYDATGAMDLLAITGIDSVNDKIMHGGASKAYMVADGTALAWVQTITYSVDAQDRLTRQVDNEAAQPIAGNVVGFLVTYWDNATPSVVFVPDTVSLQMMIQTVQVDLTVETENTKLNTSQFRQVTLTTQVTPRAIVLS
ncbi:MAG TPA: prepilin-type N-terminal cleavage/methylation domain-containing protein [Acidobacteriota bacterium]